MLNTVTPLFSFTVSGQPQDAFHVVEFNGSEGLSELYRFDCLLISTLPPDILDTLAGATASLSIHGEKGSSSYHGIIHEMTIMDMVKEMQICRVELTPRATLLSLDYNSQILLNQNFHGLLDQVFQPYAKNGLQYVEKLTANYPQHEMVCQYNESSYAFASRWMEHYGAYYFFTQEDQDTLTITDSFTAHAPHPISPSFTYARVTGLDSQLREEMVTRFDCHVRRTVASVTLNDKQTIHPSRNLHVSQKVSQLGHGTQQVFGNNYQTSSEGKLLAATRAERHMCQGKQYEGKSTVPYISAGWTYTLEGHEVEEFNQEYLITRTTHSGKQTRFLTEGLGLPSISDSASLEYSNTFTAIEQSTQFRPAIRTPRPHMAGIVSARINTTKATKYATLEDDGSYIIRYAFDRSSRGEGKTSSKISMAQPYTGSHYGIHHPLHSGTQVMVSFINGDIDRPVILGAISAKDQPGAVIDANQMVNTLRTANENRMYFDDKEKHERIILRTEAANTWLRVGKYRQFPNLETNVKESAKEAKKNVGNVLSDAKEWLSQKASGSPTSDPKEIVESLKKTPGRELLRVTSSVFRKSTQQWVGTDKDWNAHVGKNASHLVKLNSLNVTLGKHTKKVGKNGLKLVLGADVRLHISEQQLLHAPYRVQLVPAKIHMPEEQIELLKNKITLADIQKKKISNLTEHADLEIKLALKSLLTTEEEAAGEAKSLLGDKASETADKVSGAPLAEKTSETDASTQEDNKSNSTEETSETDAPTQEDDESSSTEETSEESSGSLKQEAKFAIALFNEATENADTKHIKEALMRIKIANNLERTIETRNEKSAVSITAAENKETEIENYTVDSLVSVSLSKQRSLGNKSVSLDGKIVLLGV
ncbi:type VI secretion system Vgr family protein [Halodesulfovibrio sp. MK-HDV]|uniref:type VI secretion system Vgr family protein n=1 Tax=Halodesulfovibrio sp. MK-HDV TaxID=2599925 RepID=UPI00137152F8|nr:type VI secretion system tip protein TssI/VgrG [Halodesulfovibrio sp. MK-HDV]KAF1077371.1 Actin cross-linking toxin VgrG1 [Halodesulfovibrio sp. MK-HDV]